MDRWDSAIRIGIATCFYLPWEQNLQIAGILSPPRPLATDHECFRAGALAPKTLYL
jgi:hypothetical protein